MTKNKWNWQHKEWPHFSYDSQALTDLEHKFIQSTGMIIGTFKHIVQSDKMQLIVEIMSDEALKTSEIEGELLNRDSIQASIRKNLGLDVDKRRIPPEEYGISEMMVDLYKHYDRPLSNQQLWDWHRMITNGRRDLNDIGCYRTHDDAMQIVSGRLDRPTVHFEAPPSHSMNKEMEQFILWFNDVHGANNTITPLARAGIAHLYFVSIHPFEDGNGRIGRAIAEKSIALTMQHPALLAISHTIQLNKKSYYAALEEHNTTCDITQWLLYFAQTVLDAQQHTLKLVEWLIEKAKYFDCFSSSLNERQAKAIRAMFDAGYTGFEGGLSAENYISITRTSPSTATRDLHEMVNNGILIRTGQKKSTRYWLNIEN
jgi:Fic family protein